MLSTQYTLQSAHISSDYVKTLFRNPHASNITYIGTLVLGQSIIAFIKKLRVAEKVE